jgi:hypothetical protein
LETYSCIYPNKHNLSINGLSGDYQNGYSILNLYAAKCANDSNFNPNPGKCAPQKEIDDLYSDIVSIVYFGFLSSTINHKDVSNTFKKSLVSNIFIAQPGTIFRTSYFFLKSVFYSTDFGLVFEDNEVTQLVQIAKIEETTLVNAPGYEKESFGVVQIKMQIMQILL